VVLVIPARSLQSGCCNTLLLFLRVEPEGGVKSVSLKRPCASTRLHIVTTQCNYDENAEA
jgi:hypothetical protein